MNKITIKLRLIITFAFFILLIIFMGIMLVSFSVMNKNFSSEIVKNYSQLYLYQNIYQDYNFQTQSLDNYRSTGQPEHLNKFYLYDSLITKKMIELSNPPEFDEWHGQYKRLVKIVTDNKGLPVRQFEDILSKRLALLNGDLKFKIELLIQKHADTIIKLDKTMMDINKLSIISSLGISILSVLLSGLMSLLIFKSIIYPLMVFQQGTKMIGDGNLEYRIRINSKDEIAKLAESFNSMIENLRNLQLQIVQMDRMSSIGQLAGGVAHEINNPLTGVLGQAQLLLEKLSPDSPYRRNVERIEIAAQRCRTIVRALLDFAREKNYKFIPTDINELVNETLEFTKSEMNSRKIVLEKDIPDPMPYVQVSPGHIQQVFLNIVNNAIHAMPDGGKLYISASMVENNILEIAFADTGLGIKKENIGHVFDPFFTTKDIGKGTGLGLTISYSIVKRHNGEILVKSDGENKGASFLIRLPISHNQPDEKEKVTKLFSEQIPEKKPSAVAVAKVKT
ncbi:MAG: HAMP domain-containing histidine kinase [Elusimicrobia bacterium]|nr:HAMP domain-containing histidine kinase [Candidatus Liberimonas magnetica]